LLQSYRTLKRLRSESSVHHRTNGAYHLLRSPRFGGSREYRSATSMHQLPVDHSSKLKAKTTIKADFSTASVKPGHFRWCPLHDRSPPKTDLRRAGLSEQNTSWAAAIVAAALAATLGAQRDGQIKSPALGHSTGEPRVPGIGRVTVFANPVVEAAMLDEPLSAFVVTLA
jgi:hypothetical protein